jgi:hypothetical protein
MTALTEANLSRLRTWLDREPSVEFLMKTFSSGIALDRIENIKDADKIICAICQSTPRYPLISTCGHAYCSVCALLYFTKNIKQVNDIWTVPCNTCKAPLSDHDLRTLSSEVCVNPLFPICKFYSNAKIQCENRGCGLTMCISSYNAHVFHICSRRMIQCPGNKCKSQLQATNMLNHLLYCPYQQIYCGNCESKLDVAISNHRCSLILKKRFYDYERDTDWEGPLKDHKTGDVVLPSLPRSNLDIAEEDLMDLRNILSRRRAKKIKPVMFQLQNGFPVVDPWNDDFQSN